ncbi:MAG TPA: HlyD family secretion protein [Bacteroidia bacterium]|nr:HlyD family secretion protein [Bacteroidia bacterium]
MKETDELEPQQYERIYWDEDVPVKDVRKSALRKFVYIGGAICLIFSFLAIFIKFPDQVELPFVIKSDQSEEIYRFPYPVYILESYSQPGKKVTKGQSLIRITSPEIVALVNSYVEAEKNLEIFSSQKVMSIGKQKEMIATRIRKTDSRIQETEHELMVLDSTWKSNAARLQYESDDASHKHDQNKKLFEEGHISKYELIESETKKLKANDALISARQEYQKAKYNLRSMNEQSVLDNNSYVEELSKLSIDTKYDSISLVNQYELARNRIRNTFGDFTLADNDLILAAKGNGIVSYVFEGEKQLNEGGILLKVMYNSSALYAWVKSPPALVGRVKPNHRAVLKISSFPFYEWGTLQGHVDNLSITPDETGSFSLKVAIDNFGHLNNLVQIGMNGNLTIILEEKTFYQYLFNDMKKVYYEATAQ